MSLGLRLVMKFGGTSLADGDCISRACGIVVDSLKGGNKLALVVSAMADVTDELVEACRSAEVGNRSFIRNTVVELRQLHESACRVSVTDKHLRNEVKKTVEESLKELENVLEGITYLKEVTPKIEDYVLSFGERLSAPIVWGALRSRGVDAEWFTGKEAGIVTDSNFGDAKPLMEMTVHQVKDRLQKLYEGGIVPVVAGFIAADQEGRITTLGRGGSDYTATILGCALAVDEVWFWTDVDGLMTTDPAVEPSAKTIRKLSYQEALEMAFFGAKALHPKAIELVMERGIPLRIRNTFNPQDPGTAIKADQEVEPSSVAKAISLIPKVAIITVSGAGMVGAPSVASKLFEVLGRKKVNVLMISQGSSEANISFAVPRESLDEVLNTLELSLLGGKYVREIKAEEDACIVALVGAGMQGTPGVAARIFSAVAREKINIRMIAQGSSELNISFVVKEAEGEKTVRALHREFNLGGK
ncbi:aspartate kinase [Candidatus Hecatella orcuttiae]|uniref:aspartate kinase n=1 Tax=Candidatus Hecatella orcuttiae TaxID=1935119 RepID=UPI0028682D32|nr:aspartate kinase [Candidatus Hecatella orcuttiae]